MPIKHAQQMPSKNAVRETYTAFLVVWNRMWETKESDMKSLKTTSTADFFAEWLNTLSPNGRDEICELVQMFCVIVLSSVPCVWERISRTT